MRSFAAMIRPGDVGELIDLTVEGDAETGSMAKMQREGVAALYNILCERPYAYLADEVGMGKTYQALALAAVLWSEQPDARVLFISPRQNLQVKWFGDYQRFFASNYRRSKQRRGQVLGDDRVASVLFGEPLHRAVRFQNLRSWASTIGMPERFAPFVRHTSFTRPVYITKNDLGDLDALWRRTEARLRGWGLFDVERPAALSESNASRELNLAFARAVNAKLVVESEGRPYFDLVVVDEAQCLRNPDNQTNLVLFEALRRQVGRWLFMSATPAHSGAEDIPRILNRYPGVGEVLSPALVDDRPAMQEALQAFMVRRQRRYRTTSESGLVSKGEYREHDTEAWGVGDADMSALSTLAMGLVQKGLVEVLQGRNNRYRIGFLSSFESLQSSLGRGQKAPSRADEDDDDERDGGDEEVGESSSDWHRDSAEGRTESEAPDTGFIRRLSEDFESRFGIPLPHAKVDSLVDRVAPLAFGTDDVEGGHKFLIFTRRVSTVETLRDRLTARYLASIEARIRRCWGVELDWSGSSVRLDAVDDDEDPEAAEHGGGEDPLRRAMSAKEKGWLYRYRQTFRASGRNALFFEDGWLGRLCRAGGVAPAQAAADLPEEIWAESWTHASRSAGARRQQHRADRVRYIAVQSVRRAPHVFGLSAEQAAPWQGAYEAALHGHLQQAEPDADPHGAPELFTAPTLWTTWDEVFRGTPLALPGAALGAVDHEELCRRQVARTLLGQTFRLTDTLLDLYFADEEAERIGGDFASTFLAWLSSEDPAARQVRRDCEQWLKHLRLVVDGCLDGAGRPWRELAREETWPHLFAPTAVLGVTGGSGGNRTATRQFRTPSLPRVIVCTDTLKEGVDLHLFCDRVLHYGVAWTSGDLEQRIGRVDRYFSQIERRLSKGAPPEVHLHVGYPHVVSSMERGQVERVIARQRRAEELMDSPLAGAGNEGRELVAGASARWSVQPRLEPFRPREFPREGRDLVVVSEAEAAAIASHYEDWYAALVQALRERGWRVAPDDDRPVRVVDLFGEGRQHELSWSFDGALGRYTLTVSDLPWPGDLGGGRRRRLVGRTYREEAFTRVLVPTPCEGLDDEAIRRLVEALAGAAPRVSPGARERWHEALRSVGDGAVEWLSDQEARVVVPRGDRAHRLRLRCYDGAVRLLGVVAAPEDLGHQRTREWALERTNDLPLGYLDVRPGDGLVFGVHVLHGGLGAGPRRRLVEEVAWRADMWEASLTGGDRW